MEDARFLALVALGIVKTPLVAAFALPPN